MRLADRLARTLLVLTISALIAGAAPAAALAGFCGSAPCCAAGQRALVTLDDSASGCCGPAACLEQDDDTAATKASPSVAPVLDETGATTEQIAPSLVATAFASSTVPPRALSRRLSILATLLI